MSTFVLLFIIVLEVIAHTGIKRERRSWQCWNVCFSVLMHSQLFLTPCMDCRPPGSTSIHAGISGRGIWSGLPFPPRIFHPGLNPCILHLLSFPKSGILPLVRGSQLNGGYYRFAGRSNCDYLASDGCFSVKNSKESKLWKY